jgi:formate-dependent nitrite reductase membrane component NrfD
MTEIDVARHSRFIDPSLHIWGWEIPVYLFLGGMAAGLMILSSVLALRSPDRSRVVRRLAFAAPVLVSIGMGALFLDLAFKLHVWRFYLAFRWTSPMSWGAWILVLVYPITLLLAIAGLAEEDFERLSGHLRRFGLGGVLQRARELGTRRFAGVCWTHLLTGAALGVYTGILLSTLGARALWNSALLGPLFLVSGFSTGTAFLMMFRVEDRERHLLARWDQAAILIELVLLGLFLIGLFTSGAGGKQAAQLLVEGPFAVPFWSLVVIAGLLAPLAVEILERRIPVPAVVAPTLVLLGGFALRWIFVAAGQM